VVVDPVERDPAVKLAADYGREVPKLLLLGIFADFSVVNVLGACLSCCPYPVEMVKCGR